MDFVAADSVLAVHDEPNSGEPLVQTDGGVLENGSSFQAEAGPVMFSVALPYAGIGKVGDMLGTAVRTTHRAVRPAKLHHELFAVLVFCEVEDCGLKGAGRFHEPS